MGIAQACLSLHLSKCHNVGNYMPRFIVFIYFTKKKDNLGQELQCTIKVKEDLSKVLYFQDAKYNVFKLINIKIVSHLSTKFILLVNVKMPNCWHFNIY